MKVICIDYSLSKFDLHLFQYKEIILQYLRQKFSKTVFIMNPMWISKQTFGAFQKFLFRTLLGKPFLVYKLSVSLIFYKKRKGGKARSAVCSQQPHAVEEHHTSNQSMVFFFPFSANQPASQELLCPMVIKVKKNCDKLLFWVTTYNLNYQNCKCPNWKKRSPNSA